MRFEQSRHPELVEGLLTMRKLQRCGDLVRGVQRPSATASRVLKLRHALRAQLDESAGELTRRRHWRQPFTEVITPQNLAMRVKVEAKRVEVRVWRVDRLAGCPRQRGAVDQVPVDATLGVCVEGSSRDSLGREPFDLGEPRFPPARGHQPDVQVAAPVEPVAARSCRSRRHSEGARLDARELASQVCHTRPGDSPGVCVRHGSDVRGVSRRRSLAATPAMPR